MSTAYYVADVKKKEEYDNFIDFWTNTLPAEVMSKIKSFCSEYNGRYINGKESKGLLEDSEDAIRKIRYECPLNYDDYLTEIGTATSTSFHWSGESMNLGADCFIDFDSVKKFIGNNPDYAIFNEYDEPVTLEQFEKIVNVKKRSVGA
jgi:hypothetical protein